MNRNIIVKRLVLFICMFILTLNIVVAEDQYDPQYTLQALNLAVASIHKIISSKDRVILTQEYDKIISNLNLEKIKSDKEIINLYTRLMKGITDKKIREDKKEFLKERYNKKNKRQIIKALSGLRAYGGNLKSWFNSLLTSCVSQYFSYINTKEDLKDNLEDKLFQLHEDELNDCNELMKELLTTSWLLVCKYKIPENNRVTENNIKLYYDALKRPEAESRLLLLKELEQYFQVYPPYWIDRAMVAEEISDKEEVRRCYDKFDEIWRPVLRDEDIYKSMALKYRIKEELLSDNLDKTIIINKYLNDLDKYSRLDDWNMNIFKGVVYFQIGEIDKGITKVLVNVKGGYEKEISEPLLEKMKSGKIEPFYILTDEEKAFYEQKLKPNFDIFKSKIVQTHSFYSDFREICQEYLSNFEAGIYENACKKYIEWVNKFEKDGIILKEVTLDVRFPRVYGYVPYWEIWTPFGYDYFNGWHGKSKSWENICYKLNNPDKVFKATLRDKEKGSWHNHHKDWSPIVSDKCYIFDFRLYLKKSLGNIELTFSIKMSEQDKLEYQHVVDSFYKDK